VKKLLAGLVAFVAIALLLAGLVGLLSARTATGLVLAGYVCAGGGIVLARLAWRLWLGLPGLHALAEGRSEAEVRLLSREHARRQWQAAATYFLGLAVVYLLLALVFATYAATLPAAAIAAVTAGVLTTMAWWQRRTLAH